MSELTIREQDQCARIALIEKAFAALGKSNHGYCARLRSIAGTIQLNSEYASQDRSIITATHESDIRVAEEWLEERKRPEAKIDDAHQAKIRDWFLGNWTDLD